MLLQVIDIRDVFDISLADKRFHRTRAESLHIHGIFRYEIGDGAAVLGVAFLSGAVQMGAIRLAFHGRAADGAMLWQLIGDGPLRALFLYYGKHLGNDVAGFLHDHRVANAHVFFVDVVLVVQRCPGHCGLCQAHRVQNGKRRNPSCAPHLHDDILHHGFFLLRRVFIRGSPAGYFGGHAQAVALSQAVDLNHCAVQAIGKRPAHLFDAADGLPHLVCRAADLIAGAYGKSLFCHKGQGFGVAFELPPLADFQVEYEDVQLALSDDCAVQLAHGAGSAVSPVLVYLAAALQLLFVGFLEAFGGHVHLATHLQIRQLCRDGFRNRADFQRVFIYALSDFAVASGDGFLQNAVVIAQHDGQAVDLALYHKFRLCKLLLHLFHKGVDLFFGKYVLKADDGNVMLYFFQLPLCRAAHFLCRRIHSGKHRVFAFQPPQL